MGILTLMAAGPASGTYTASPTANRIGVYLYAGGGRGNGGCCVNRSGGVGGGGFWNKPITQPFSQPYSVAGPSNGAGANTTMANVGTANGGNGATVNANGNSGTQPGSNVTIPPEFRGGGTVSTLGNASYSNRTFSQAGLSGGGCFSGNGGAIIVFENTGT
jgi:hypothetical protein